MLMKHLRGSRTTLGVAGSNLNSPSNSALIPSRPSHVTAGDGGQIGATYNLPLDTQDDPRLRRLKLKYGMFHFFTFIFLELPLSVSYWQN